MKHPKWKSLRSARYIYPNLAPLSTQLTRMAQQGISFSEIGCNSALMTRCQKTADPDRYDTTSCFGGGMARKDSCILWRYGEDTSLSKSIVGAQQQPCKWVRIDMGKSCPRFMQVVKSYPVWDGLWPWPYSLGSLSLTSSRPSFRMIKPSPDSRAKRLCLLFRPAKVALCLSNCKLYGDYKAETWCQTQMSEGFWPPCSVRCLGIATWTSCGLTGDLPLFLCFLFLILQKKLCYHLMTLLPSFLHQSFGCWLLAMCWFVAYPRSLRRKGFQVGNMPEIVKQTPQLFINHWPIGLCLYI